jgi:hypothetical protein
MGCGDYSMGGAGERGHRQATIEQHCLFVVPLACAAHDPCPCAIVSGITLWVMQPDCRRPADAASNVRQGAMDSRTPLFRVGDSIILTHPYRGIPAGSAGKITALASMTPPLYRVHFGDAVSADAIPQNRLTHLAAPKPAACP